ncbi:hypothetical protein V5F53_02265 [Xanthobacter sp. V4C-4]|uniref:hypothetical protein n=1 Tax=Xanthobacter cornucopiae TaxID=3119924 RepID=UPI00372AFB64
MGKTTRAILWGVVVAGGLCLALEARAGCAFARIDNVQVKALLDQVKDPRVPELDRGFALETVICDDRPQVREQAMKEALAAADSPMLRSIILAQILYQAKTLRLELQETPQLAERARQYVRENQGVLALSTGLSFPVEGCVNLSTNSECGSDHRIRIQGTKIDLKIGNASDGVLELKDGGVLVGYFRPSSGAGLIPARINLF